MTEAERDAIAATTAGTGELILAASRRAPGRVYLGVGGSATTDGGAGAIRAIERGGGLGDVQLVVLCDVRTPFEDAARVFAPRRAPTRRGARLTRGCTGWRAAANAIPAESR